MRKWKRSKPSRPEYKGTKYRSKFEAKLAELGMSEHPYESERIKYSVTKESLYTPDWVIELPHGGSLLIEAKGWFRTKAESDKYLAIKDVFTGDQELVFIFADPNKKAYPGIRKHTRSGYLFTMGEWADKHGFKYFTPERLGDLFKYARTRQGET